MLFRLFAYSNNKDEAKFVFNSIIKNIESSIVYKEYKKIEPYWKIDGIYVVEVKVEFYKGLYEKNKEEFLKSIADKWTVFGNPIQEIIASDTTEGCMYIKKGIKMINIFY
ncbi:hypothetical protein A0J52_01625 [Clostridium sporogenes]|uniref:hypothetical protein n=1 Tax=Clostridium sporogenes TaxID=1509 RepID=UPI00077FEE50|nr:hypothetical protein [Clostridium sporogenes]KYN78010.1 hypothetical protein A0J52_01625 [Clostridium sporogenes]